MGCNYTKEEVESKMLELYLKRARVRQKKQILIKELEFVSGNKVRRPFIPDFVDHQHMKEIREGKERPFDHQNDGQDNNENENDNDNINEEEANNNKDNENNEEQNNEQEQDQDQEQGQQQEQNNDNEAENNNNNNA